MFNVTLIVPVDYRIELLPYHVGYYQRLGVKDFVYALWNGTDSPVYDPLLRAWHSAANKSSTIRVFASLKCDYSKYSGPAEVPRLNEIRAEFVGPDEWYCVADLDEFYRYTGQLGGMTLPQVAEALAATKRVATHGSFYDRVAYGTFPVIPPYTAGTTALDTLFPMTANLTGTNAAKCTLTKIGVARGHVPITSGHHAVNTLSENVWYNTMQVHHFKWNHGVIEVLRSRHESYVAQKLGWAEEPGWFADYLSRPDWHLNPDLKMRLADKIGPC